MAAVTLLPAVLSLVADPAQSVASFTADWSEKPSVDVSVRSMANGRRRVVRRAGSSVSLSWTMRLLTREQVVLVKSWAGREVMIRDRQGRKEFGVYQIGSVSDFKAGDAHDVSFTFESVSYDESV